MQIPSGIFIHNPPHEEIGVLDLGVAISGGKSIATRQYHTRAMKIIRPHYLDDSGQVFYIIANPGGGYLGGDAYRMNISVAEGASLLLTDQSATKVYRTPEDFVVQNISFKVEAGAVFEYIPNQLILYRDADFRQQITADVSPTGSLFMTDIITPGWSPDGELFSYKQARLRNEITVGDELALVDNLRINPLLSEFGEDKDFFMAGRTHVATAICFDPGIDSELIDEIKAIIKTRCEANQDMVGALSECDRPGFMLRALGSRTEDLHNLMLAAANHVRKKLRGQGKINLRQY
uniref:urease accessory protein UreD n=1 Tax=Vaginimicrobium propionicum TaxID=1871034 RepID=UPI00097038BF|nr:urease accessory protein UreD [Vaginimicrobium propionicum]